eukprot:scaffold131745_cov66-Phaeocystis_antarctica.AAC.7
MEVRDIIEKEILARELREEEVAPKHLGIVGASFKLGDQLLGIHLNAYNVILRIDPGSLAQQEGTLQVGDRIVTVNSLPCVEVAVKDLLQDVGDSLVTFVAARLERAGQTVAPADAVQRQREAVAAAEAEAAAEARSRKESEGRSFKERMAERCGGRRRPDGADAASERGYHAYLRSGG